MIKTKLILCAIFVLYFSSLNSNSLKIYVNSIPKCGTHLLLKCLELLTESQFVNLNNVKLQSNTLPELKENFFSYHLEYSKKSEKELKNKRYKTFFIYRDPRDKIISHAFWIQKLKNKEFCQNEICQNLNQIINRLIKVIPYSYSLYLPWKNSNFVCSIKFEDLIGKNGGGYQLLQKREIIKICKFLNIECSKKIKNCIDNMFGDTVTFRSGKIGEWKQYFTKKHKQEFKKIAGKLLIDLGYEKDFNW